MLVVAADPLSLWTTMLVGCSKPQRYDWLVLLWQRSRELIKSRGAVVSNLPVDVAADHVVDLLDAATIASIHRISRLCLIKSPSSDQHLITPEGRLWLSAGRVRPSSTHANQFLSRL